MLEVARNNEVSFDVPIKVTWTMLVRYDENGIRFLLAERTDCLHRKRLTFPGGKLKRSEFAQDAAARELQEETHLKINPEMLIPASVNPYRYFDNGGFYEATSFIAFADKAFGDGVAERREPSEQKKWGWYTMTQLVQAAMDGMLPHAIFKDDLWIDIATLYAFQQAHGDEYFQKRAPAWYLQKCEQIRYKDGYEQFKRALFDGRRK